jgi:hypothetical protein
MVFQLGAWLVTRSDQYDFRLFFVGFDERTMLIIVLMVSIGVTMPVILKKLSNIVKIFVIAFQSRNYRTLVSAATAMRQSTRSLRKTLDQRLGCVLNFKLIR